VREGEWVWWELGGGEFEKKSFAVSLFGIGMRYNGRNEAIFGAGRRNGYGGNWGFLWTN